jgi:hypothetical protein
VMKSEMRDEQNYKTAYTQDETEGKVDQIAIPASLFRQAKDDEELIVSLKQLLMKKHADAGIYEEHKIDRIGNTLRLATHFGRGIGLFIYIGQGALDWITLDTE